MIDDAAYGYILLLYTRILPPATTLDWHHSTRFLALSLPNPDSIRAERGEGIDQRQASSLKSTLLYDVSQPLIKLTGESWTRSKSCCSRVLVILTNNRHCV